MKTLNLFFNIETNLIFIINYDLNEKKNFFILLLITFKKEHILSILFY